MKRWRYGLYTGTNGSEEGNTVTIDELRDNLQSGGNLTITANGGTTTAYPSIMADHYIVDERLIPVAVIVEFQNAGQWNVRPESEGTDHHATD